MADANLSLKIREVDFPDIKDAWQELEQAGDLPTIFQCYGWIEPWWRHLGHGKKILLAAYEGDLLVGIAPMFIERMTLKGIPFFNIMRFMGTPESDYHAFILRQGYQEKALSALLTALKQYNWDIAWLSDVKPDTSTADLLTKCLKAGGLHFMERQHTPCPYIILPPLYDDYIKSLSKSIRLNSNNYYNKMLGVGKVAVETFSQESNVAEGMDYFFSLHRQRWEMKGEGGALKNEHIQSFHHEVAAGLFNYLRLSFLIVDGLRISVMYGYRYKDTEYNYLPGFDSNWSKYRPGTILLLKLIENAISAGVSCFDFMRGDEEYKYHFTETTRCNLVYYCAKNPFKWCLFKVVEGL